MNYLDGQYVPTVGDIVLEHTYGRKKYSLVVGCTKEGILCLYDLYIAFHSDTEEYNKGIVSSTLKYTLEEILNPKKLRNLSSLPLSIAYNNYKGLNDLSYIYSIEKRRVVAWLIKSSLVVETFDYSKIQYDYKDILERYRLEMTTKPLISTNEFKKFNIYQYKHSSRLILALGVINDYKVYLSLDTIDTRNLANIIIAKVTHTINTNGKVFLTNELKNINSVNYEIPEEDKDKIRELVKLRGINL